MAVRSLHVVTARNEADRLAATLTALARAFPAAPQWVADDCSTDATRQIASDCDAQIVSADRALGKGGVATLAARAALTSEQVDDETVVVLCDGDLGDSAERLAALVRVVEAGEADLSVARFSSRVGGGFGVALGFARFAIRRRCGFHALAPISGQRALRASLLRELLPFAPGFGMEIGMTIDAVRHGYRVAEVELDLNHRATSRTPAGFAHRGRQLVDFVRVYRARR